MYPTTSDTFSLGRKARQKFRADHNTDELLIQGQFGELLLFHFIQRFMQATPLLRKMKIATSSEHERFGADAIHYKIQDAKNIIILGEAKTYSSNYKFATAFSDALNSIINTYKEHRRELNLYVHEDFLDNEMNQVAEDYLNNTLENVEVHLVSIITYNENKKLEFDTETGIKNQIETIIAERYHLFDNNKIDIENTLLQGVNLPAQNVFIRNPHLYVKKQKQSSELTNYEMANLRGRAGRLLKDYIGRTFVMDEDEFIDSEGYEQLELFEDVTKELPSGYEQKFEEYKDFIEEALDNNTPVDATMKKYGYIISYIRQSVLKYGAESRGRMKNVGIKLTQKQVAAIILKLDSIDVPKEICYKNRYWDPLVLDYIYNEYDGKLPNTPMEKGAKSKLDKAMRFLRENDVTAEMYNKNIPSTYRKRTMRSIMSSLSLQWATGKALCEILNNSRYEGDDGADNIDSTIELLQNTISYNLPLLLKPLYDMKQSESPFLKCMQVGAFGVVERCMIEMGVPRESALYLYKEIFDEKEIKVENRLELEQIIREKIRLEYKNIPYWIQVQLDFLI